MIIDEPDTMPAAPRSFLDVKDTPDAPLGEQFVSAFELENTAISALVSEDSSFAPVEGYNPADEIEGYEGYAESFMDAESPEETAAIKRQIDREQYNREITDTGFGMFAKGVASITDPVLLPFLFLRPFSAGAGALKASAQGAAVIGGSEALAEAGLQEIQETRTTGESLARVVGAAVIGGAFSGVLAKMDQGYVKQLEQKVTDDLLADETPVEKAINSEPRSVGAAAAQSTTKEQEEMLSAGGMDFGMTPAARLANSPFVTARRTFQRLAENAFTTKKNLDGTATATAVETRVKGYDAFLSKGIQGIDESFLAYKNASTRLTAAMKGGLNRREFNIEISKAMRRGDTHEIPEVAQAAQKMRREVFDPIKERAIDMGLLPANVTAKYADSYLSRMYNFTKISQNPQRFQDTLRDWFSKSGGDKDEIEQAISEVMDKITGKDRDVAGTTAVTIVPKADALKERMLAIPDWMIEEYLENDIEGIAKSYVRQMGTEVEMVREFGQRDIGGEISALADDLAMLKKGKSAKEAEKLDRQYESAVADLQALEQRLYGKYGQPLDPSGWYAEASAAIRTLNLVRMLGGMTVSAFPDLSRPIAVNGLRTWAHSIGAMITHPAIFRMSMKEAKEMGVGLDMVLNTRLNRIGDVDDFVDSKTAAGRGIRALGDTFGIPSLMAPWNATVKQFAGVMTANRILHAVTKASIGKNTATKLARSGIDAAMAKRIAAQYKKFGEHNGIYLSHASKWTDKEAYEIFSAAVLKDVDTAIVTPGIADKPLWFSNEHGKIATQFQSFSMAAQNRILISGLQQRDMAQLNGALIAIALGGLTYATKQKLRGAEVSTDPAVIAKEAFDYSGLSGWMMNPVNTFDWATKGGMTEMLTGEKTPSSRYSSRGVEGALLGPTLSTILDPAAISQDIATGEVDEATIRRVRRLLPYQNLFWLRNALNALEDEIAESVQ